MDKAILDKLIKFGLVTNIGVDASKYKDVDELIAKGVITIPGAKTRIMQLLEGLEIQSVSTDTESITDVEIKEDETTEVTDTTEVDETEAPTKEIVDAVEIVEETPAEETVTEEAPAEEVVETPTEETPAEETVETTEETPKKKKSTKKAE